MRGKNRDRSECCLVVGNVDGGIVESKRIVTIARQNFRPIKRNINGLVSLVFEPRVMYMMVSTCSTISLILECPTSRNVPDIVFTFTIFWTSSCFRVLGVYSFNWSSWRPKESNLSGRWILTFKSFFLFGAQAPANFRCTYQSATSLGEFGFVLIGLILEWTISIASRNFLLVS